MIFPVNFPENRESGPDYSQNIVKTRLVSLRQVQSGLTVPLIGFAVHSELWSVGDEKVLELRRAPLRLVKVAFQQPNCGSCQTPLTDQTLQARGGWDRSPGGDEYFDEIHRCSRCEAWYMLTFVDRFAGPDECRLSGPLTSDEIEEQRLRLSS